MKQFKISSKYFYLTCNHGRYVECVDGVDVGKGCFPHQKILNFVPWKWYIRCGTKFMSKDARALYTFMVDFTIIAHGRRSRIDAPLQLSSSSCSLLLFVLKSGTGIQSSQQYHHPNVSRAYLDFFCCLTCLQIYVYKYSGL